MDSRADRIRQILVLGPAGARQLLERTGFSQPTLSRALAGMGAEVLRMGAARSIQYALRDSHRAAWLGVDDISVYRVDTQGRAAALGGLTPVRPEGFLMRRVDGAVQHTEGLPWWLLDMRPQGYLGRAYVARNAAPLGLPTRLTDWNDTHALRALLAHGQDAVGNLLLGDMARDRFLHAPAPHPIGAATEIAAGTAYAHLAREAASGELPGSSAGGEQPKFTAYVQTPGGPRHVLVKFTQMEDNPVTERWRDLLMAEHHALLTLHAAGVQAAQSRIVDHEGQRFLEMVRFDRVSTETGAGGRRALFSLAALEAEFIGDARAPWPVLAARLAGMKLITPEAAQTAALLHAFGTLIGNTDMHNGNLSFTSDDGFPCALAPAYDMLPMGYAPLASGSLPSRLPAVHLHASVEPAMWRRALVMARDYLARLSLGALGAPRFSASFGACLADLAGHLADADGKIARLG